MAQPAIAGKRSFLAHRRTVSPNTCLEYNRSTAGSPLAPSMDLTPAQVGYYLSASDWKPALFNYRMGMI